MKICVIGAGFFGSLSAIKLAEKGHQVHLLECEDDILQGASKHNHNRIHLGYHYLRSIETAKESREGLETFSDYFSDAICSTFKNYYAIAAVGSKSSPQNFEKFCCDVQIPFEADFPDTHLLNRSNVAACYRVPEPVFDYFRVYKLLATRLANSTVKLMASTEVVAVERVGEHYSVQAPGFLLECDAVVNCTYNRLNQIDAMLGVTPKLYLFEDVEIPIFAYEHPMVGLTVMDGEFCSVMPRGIRANEFLLYHVNYSVLARNLGTAPPFPHDREASHSNIISESAEYFPFLRDCSVTGRYRWMRMVAENDDDARRSIVSSEAPNYWRVLSGKVTTCVDVANRLVRSIN